MEMQTLNHFILPSLRDVFIRQEQVERLVWHYYLLFQIKTVL